MNRRFPVLVLIVLLGLGGREALWGEWARLRDGSIVRITERKADRVAVEDAQGERSILASSEIDGLLSTPVAARIVNDMMELIGHPETHDTVRKKLKQIGMAAVPQLLTHLGSRDLDQRRAALAGLQMVWSKEAEAPVRAFLNDKDAYCRSMALHLVQLHFPQSERLQALATLSESAEDPALQGTALAAMLAQTPDVEKMQKAMENPSLWEALHRSLPRYQAPAFRAASLQLLTEGTEPQKASAIVALIYQMDDRATTRDTIVAFLTHRSPNLRELAAEYLRWHGTSLEIAALELQRKSEPDAHTQASIEAAITAILRRETRFTLSPAPPASTTSWPESPEEAYTAASRRLRDSPDTSTRSEVLKLLVQESYEPVYHYSEKWRLRPAPRHSNRTEAVSLAFGFPTSEARAMRRQKAFGSGGSAPIAPVARELMSPIRDYFDPERQSFGLFVNPEREHPFSNSHHVGDDIAFGAQQRTVVAIGDGLVRVADTGRLSWGGLVILEHRTPEGSSFCSLYGHLGPLIDVQAGDRVERGQKLGTLGRDHVFTTGGYRSHLHFGIHLSDFAHQGQAWITGYLSPQRYHNKTSHRWVDPQKFLEARLEATLPRP